MNKFNSTALQCVRITTILNNHNPEYLSSFCKIATGGSFVDNWDHGSLLVGIDHRTGKLLPVGYSKPHGFLQKIYLIHPDTKIPFAGFQIPHFAEAVRLCLKAHNFFYARFIIGWDVAITQEGPVIIEVNDHPILHPQQMIYGGMKKRIKSVSESYVGSRSDGVRER